MVAAGWASTLCGEGRAKESSETHEMLLASPTANYPIAMLHSPLRIAQSAGVGDSNVSGT